jgi:hypothetical protein
MFPCVFYELPKSENPRNVPKIPLSQKLRGFEQCRAATIFRQFINMRADIVVRGDLVNVNFPRRAHNPIIKAAQLDKAATIIPWLGNRRVQFGFH